MDSTGLARRNTINYCLRMEGSRLPDACQLGPGPMVSLAPAGPNIHFPAVHLLHTRRRIEGT
jgi:hypothetical protein